jgi:hypothetical protein
MQPHEQGRECIGMGLENCTWSALQLLAGVLWRGSHWAANEVELAIMFLYPLAPIFI